MIRIVAPHTVEVLVRGRAGPSLVAALDGFAVTSEPGGDTRITGSVADQSMLLGLLQLFSDLGHEVISVNPVDDGPDKEK